DQHRLLLRVAARRDRPLRRNRDVHRGRPVRLVLALAVVTGFVLAPAPSAEGAGDRPRVAVSVSPAQLAVAAPSSRRINVRNDGSEQVVVVVARRALPRQTAAKAWLQIVPGRLLLRSGRSAF